MDIEKVGLAVPTVQRLSDLSSQALSELEQHIGGLPVDAKRIQGLSVSTPITGQVASGGTITAGTGFSVNKTGTGVYVITFTTAFSATPTLVATLVDSSTTAGRIIKIQAISSSSVTLATQTGTGSTFVDLAFHFVAFATA